MAMIPVTCPHCDLSFAVREETAGRKFQCPGCLDQFTVPEPPRDSAWRIRPLDATEKEAPSRTATADLPSAKLHRKKKRKSSKKGRQPKPPSDATLWIGGISLLLFGILVGLVIGHRMFAHADSPADELLAELDAEPETEDGPANQGDDPNSPEGMILGKWVGGLHANHMTYDFFKDGTVTVETGKRKHDGEYRILSPTSIWIKGSTGAATMDMKLAPDELELTIHSKLNLESKTGSGQTEKSGESFDITLKFKRPGAAPDPPVVKGPDSKPKPPPQSSAPKDSPGKTQPPKTSPRGSGRSSWRGPNPVFGKNSVARAAFSANRGRAGVSM
jgi:hypothetical protein